MTVMQLLSLMIVADYVNSQSNVCIWGASSTNQRLNGEYVYAGANIGSNGKPYYRLIVDSSCAIQGKSTFYLYNYQNIYWMIGDTVGSTNVFALCSSSSNEPIACNNNWSSGFGASSVQTTYGSCPSWNCGIITTSFPTNDICQTEFNEKIGVNQWKGYNQLQQKQIYFYFAPQYFAFICDDSIDDTCNINAYDKTSGGWTSISQGQSTNIVFQTASIQTINCVAPTRQPTTSEPTTKTPTVFPTTTMPTTSIPTTYQPTTSVPTTAIPTTLIPTTRQPTTNTPTATIPIVSVSETNINGNNARECCVIASTIVVIIIQMFLM
eukprot:428743_1